MIDSPEITTLEFGSSHVFSSLNLMGLYVDHESACNRFRVRELNTGGQEWILSDLQPLYGHQFSGGDIEIKVATPLAADTFAGYSGSRLLLVRRASAHQDTLPNLPLVPIGRATTRIVRQIARMPTAAVASHTLASVYTEGYNYVSCAISFADITTLAGASWRIIGFGPTAGGSPMPDSPQVFATAPRAPIVGSGKGNAVPALTGGLPQGWDIMSVAAEPFAFQKAEVEIFNVPLAFVGQPAPSVIWYFSNQPMTERF